MPRRGFKFDLSALIFDMDGVITDTMPYHFRAWKSIFAPVPSEARHEPGLYRLVSPLNVTPQRILAQLISAILPSVHFRFAGRTTKRVDLSTHPLVDCEKAQDALPDSLVARWEVN